MYSDKDQYIFVHVPRTGGHSIYSMLGIDMEPRRFPLHVPRKDIDIDCYSFGFIRNPWARMYSCYRRQKDFTAYKGKGFKRYLLEGIKDNGINNQAMYFLDGCDFIGKYENLQSDCDKAMIEIGRTPAKLPHINQYGPADYRPHYDNEIIDHIAVHHKDDIAYGGYSF